MKRAVLASFVVVAALVLSACGSSPAARQATIDAYVGSLGASPNLQVTLTATAHGAGMTTAAPILKALTFTMDFADPTNSSLSSASTSVNLDMTVTVDRTTLVDVRDVDNNFYMDVDVTAFNDIPGVHIGAHELAAIQLAFGGRWFELPTSVLNQIVPTSDASKAMGAEDKSDEVKVIHALTTYIDTVPYKSLGNGTYSISGTILSVAKALDPVISSLTKVSAPTPANAKGTFTVTISSSGTTATGGSVSITSPNGTKGNATVTLAATFAHAATPVVAPAGATVLTSSMLEDLFGIDTRHVSAIGANQGSDA